MIQQKVIAIAITKFWVVQSSFLAPELRMEVNDGIHEEAAGRCLSS